METQNVISTNPLVIIDMQRYVTQKQYCEMHKAKNLTAQNLQNMITRNQVKTLYVEQLGLTLIDTQADDKATVELAFPKAAISYGQIGEFMAKWTIEIALKNRDLETALQEKESLIVLQSSELSKQSEVITQNNYAIEELAYINNDFREKLKNLMSELQIKDCEITKQGCELTKQSEVITQNNLEITELKEKVKVLETEKLGFETELAAQKATNLNLLERLEVAKEKAALQADKIQILNQELNTGLMSKLVELVNGKQAAEQVNEQAEVKPQYFVVLAKNNQSSNQLQEAISELMKSYKNIMIDDVEDFFITVRTEVDKLNMQSSCKEEFVKLTEFTAEDLHAITIGEKFQLTIRKVCKSL